MRWETTLWMPHVTACAFRSTAGKRVLSLPEMTAISLRTILLIQNLAQFFATACVATSNNRDAPGLIRKVLLRECWFGNPKTLEHGIFVEGERHDAGLTWRSVLSRRWGSSLSLLECCCLPMVAVSFQRRECVMYSPWFLLCVHTIIAAFPFDIYLRAVVATLLGFANSSAGEFCLAQRV